MGAPRKDAHEKRIETARFRTTIAEQEFIRDQARIAGMTPTDYMRARTLGHRVSTAPANSGVSPALISELNRIGVNLNQLAKHANAGRGAPNSWAAARKELRNVLRRVLSDGS